MERSGGGRSSGRIGGCRPAPGGSAPRAMTLSFTATTAKSRHFVVSVVDTLEALLTDDDNLDHVAEADGKATATDPCHRS